MSHKFVNFVYWVEDNGGKFPRHDAKNDLEKRMYSFWKTSKEVKQIHEKYSDILSFKEAPGYQKYLRMYFAHMREKSVFTRMLNWLDTHDGKKPQSYNKMKNKVRLGTVALTEDQREERALYARWNSSEERKILESYRGVEITKVPLMYRECIDRMRAYGYGIDPLPVYPRLLKWLEVHKVEPRGSIRDSKGLLSEKEKKEEIDLRKDWDKSEEKKIFMKYAGVNIEDVPTEHREMVKTLRSYGLEKMEIDVYSEITDWLEDYGRLPRSEIRGPKKAKLRAELTEAEKYEVRLRELWNNSDVKETLESYVGIPLEEILEDDREMVETLRYFGLGLPKLKVKNVYEEYVAWLSEYGKRPRTAINKGNNTFKIRAEMTDLEAYELSLAQRFQRTKIRDVLNEYFGKDIELVPEEYRKQVATLRSLGEVGKSKEELLKRRMKAAVSRQVKHNQEVRDEIIPKKERSLED